MAPATPTGWAIPREEAIPRLLDLHGGRLLGLGQRICGTPEEAEDLVQEIFVQAWRKWDQFDGRSDPFVWLYTIARRICQRMHRKRAGEPERLESLDVLAQDQDARKFVECGPKPTLLRMVTQVANAIDAEGVELYPATTADEVGSLRS